MRWKPKVKERTEDPQVHNVFFWQSQYCPACKHFVWLEHGWRGTWLTKYFDVFKGRYICKKCAPTEKQARKHFESKSYA